MTTTQQTRTEPGPTLASQPERVLLATDGGLAGVAAVRWLADRAHRDRVEAVIVDVVDADPLDVLTGEPREAPAVRAVEQAQQLLQHLAPLAAVRTDVHRGDPVTTLQQAAAGMDLLVVGSNRTAHGVPHLTAAFATRLAAGCPCPVVVVPRGWEPSSGPVVVGVEGDGSDDAALEFAAREAEALGRHLVLVHAWRMATVVAPALAVDLDRDAVERQASARLSEVAERVRTAHPDVRIAPVLGHDEPVRTIVRAEQGASLVVVGTHGLTAVDRLLLKSVSRGVLERPACPVAVVPTRNDAG